MSCNQSFHVFFFFSFVLFFTYEPVNTGVSTDFVLMRRNLREVVFVSSVKGKKGCDGKLREHNNSLNKCIPWRK